MEELAVTIPHTRRVDFKSKVNGRYYSISIGLPFDPPPQNGYRVLYVLDGYAYFGSATEAVRINGNAPATVVVGIGYPDSPEFIESVLAHHGALTPHMAALAPIWAAVTLGRCFDLSLPASDEVLAPMQMGLTSKDVGGLDNFLKTIETEVKPRVADIVAIDSSNQAIFGHSLGGLAVLHALFTEPNAFRTFVAASPSIHWGRNAVLAGEERFSAAVRDGAARPRVLLTMGADEDVVVPTSGADSKAVEEARRQSRMVETAGDLSVRLQALRGTSPYEVEDYAVFPRQGHGISPWPALGRAISFAFPRAA